MIINILENILRDIDQIDHYSNYFFRRDIAIEAR